MQSLDPGPELIGRSVRHAARPEWGTGRVLRVRQVQRAPAVWQVCVQFGVGTRTLRIPPARLIEPVPEAGREAGWIDRIGGTTRDDLVTRLPQRVMEALSPTERLDALLALYRWSEAPGSLIDWARRQADVADPLSHWTRDELTALFERFCDERDAALRAVVAKLRRAGEQARLDERLAALDSAVRERVMRALVRVV